MCHTKGRKLNCTLWFVMQKTQYNSRVRSRNWTQESRINHPIGLLLSQYWSQWSREYTKLSPTFRIVDRHPDFEKYILKCSVRAMKTYARNIIEGRWREAEDAIIELCERDGSSDNINAACDYARFIVKGRWREAEHLFLNEKHAWNYWMLVVRGVIEDGNMYPSRWQQIEPFIAKNSSHSYNYAFDTNERFLLGEPSIAKCDMEARRLNLPFANLQSLPSYLYATKFCNDWSEWSEETIALSSCWSYLFAKDVCKGKLPKFLHNSMIAHAMKNPKDYYVKVYFSAKKYRF